MEILYIGNYTPGTTSQMRADHLKQVLKDSELQIIDTHIPFYQTSRIFRSVGFRIKKGPLIRSINRYVINEVSKFKTTETKLFDLIWIDKGIFLTTETMRYLKSLSYKLLHFTPDMAFFANQSTLFENSLIFYDYVVTTKSAEKAEYIKRIGNEKFILTTQGYSKDIHHPIVDFEKKTNDVAFIGLCEPSRERIVKELIKANISVKIAGKGWKTFFNTHKSNRHLSYHGEGIFGDAYTHFISSSYFSIGLLSKKFPELHTTRTFEIPACGTALLTERNNETTSFFEENEAIFYSSVDEIIDKINYYSVHLQELETLIHNGTNRVNEDVRDYESILYNILIQINLL